MNKMKTFGLATMVVVMSAGAALANSGDGGVPMDLYANDNPHAVITHVQNPNGTEHMSYEELIDFESRPGGDR